MRIPLAWKTTLLTTIPVAVVGVIIGLVVYVTTTEVLIDHERVDLKDDTKLRGDWVLDKISTLREDVLTLSRSAQIQGIVRARTKDPEANIDELRTELASLMKTQCVDANGPKPYLQVCFIGKVNHGRELVRIEKSNGADSFSPVPLPEIDTDEKYEKDKEPYFKEIKELADSYEEKGCSVYLSPIELNVERGQKMRGEPVLRASAPVFDENGEYFGFVIINLDFNGIRNELASSPRHLVYLTNEEGDFLIHPNEENEFVWDDETQQKLLSTQRVRIQDQPEFAELQGEEMYTPKYDDNPVLMSSGAKCRKLELLGFGFKNMFKPEHDAFALARIDCIGMLDGDWDQFGEDLQQIRDKRKRTVKIPPLDVIKQWNYLPVSASTDQGLKDVITDLKSKAYGPKLRTVYKVHSDEFFAHYFRLYFDPANPDRYLGLVMAFSRDELVWGELKETRQGVLGSAIVVLLPAALLGIVFSYLLNRRLGQIKRASDRIGKGDFDVVLPVKGRDEIGDLARGFQHMIEEVRARGAEILVREERLSAIVDTAAEGIVTVDDAGFISEFNLAAEKMFGYADEEAQDQPVLTLLAPAFRQQLADGMHRLSEPDAREPNVSLEAVGHRKDGSEFPLEVSISSVNVEASRLFTFIIRDITESKRARAEIEQLNADLDRRVRERTAELETAMKELTAARDKAHELSRAKDAFLASVSHELRNPLNQVSGFCQLLELTELDDEQRADLLKIRAAGETLLTLINDILDYQKIIMSGVSLEPDEFDVAKLLHDVHDAMKFQAPENKNELRFSYPEDIGTMFADRNRVRQVLVNLIGNACKFTSKGSIDVTVKQELASTPMLIFEVKDTGRGMTPEEQSKLFTPFTKLAASKGNRTGTGLGLVISKGFCELMGGEIRLTSEFGKGTTFTVRLPVGAVKSPHAGDGVQRELTDVSSVTQPADASSAAAETVNGAELVETASRAHELLEDALPNLANDPNKTVLVIDDDPSVLELMERYLTSRGFHIVTAANGFEGLELAQRIHPAAITLDAVMPGLDGWAVLAALKAGQETADIPVVMVTILDKEEKGKAMGVADFLTKPIQWDRLSHVLSKYAGEKKQQRRILVVDDDASTREVIRRFLENDGWQVQEAAHGAEALELLAIEQPAAIILDLMMPVMDGFEFLSQYCQLSEWLSIPVVVLSAKDPTPEEREQLNGLVVRVLRKGEHTQEELLREIHRQVDNFVRRKPLESNPP